MAKLSEHLTDRGLPIQNRGLPALNLDEVARTAVPSEWDIESLFGDILMCEFIDENEHGDVMKGGIFVKQEISHNLWRVAKVIMKGPGVSDQIEVGDHLMIPGNKGLPGISKEGKTLIFLNEERLFAKVKKPD